MALAPERRLAFACWRGAPKHAWLPEKMEGAYGQMFHDEHGAGVQRGAREPCRARRQLSKPTGARRGRILRRLRRRHHRTRRRAADGTTPRPADRGREPDRSRIQPCRRVRGAGSEGRLHAIAGDDGQSHQCGRGLQSLVRLGEGFCAGRAAHHDAQHSRRSPVRRREQRQGADRAGQEQARSAVVRLVGGSDRNASVR